MYEIRFREPAQQDLKGLPHDVQYRILQKLEYFRTSGSPLSFAHRLKDTKAGSYRFRVGDYRIIFDVIEQVIVILSVGHRREIYK